MCAPRARPPPVSTLSGGNQKGLFARVLLRGPRVLIADEPTRGVDVGAKRAIYDLLTSLAAGRPWRAADLFGLEEVLGLAHRVLVMRRGKITAELSGGDLTEAAILGAGPPKRGDHEPARRHRRGRPAAGSPSHQASDADGAPGRPPGGDAGTGPQPRRPEAACRARAAAPGPCLPVPALFVVLSVASGPRVNRPSCAGTTLPAPSRRRGPWPGGDRSAGRAPAYAAHLRCRPRRR